MTSRVEMYSKGAVDAKDADFVDGPTPWIGELHFGETKDVWGVIVDIDGPEEWNLTFDLLDGRRMTFYTDHDITILQSVVERAKLKCPEANQNIGWLDVSRFRALMRKGDTNIAKQIVERLQSLSRDLFRLRIRKGGGRNSEDILYAVVTQSYMPILADRIAQPEGVKFKKVVPSDGLHGGYIEAELDLIPFGMGKAEGWIDTGWLTGNQACKGYFTVHIEGAPIFIHSKQTLLPRRGGGSGRRIHRGSKGDRFIVDLSEKVKEYIDRIKQSRGVVAKAGDTVVMLEWLVKREVLSKRTAAVVVSLLEGRTVDSFTELRKNVTLFRLSAAFAKASTLPHLSDNIKEDLRSLSSSVLDVVPVWSGEVERWRRQVGAFKR